MKRNIYTIGETVYDIIFDRSGMRAGKAGGSMLNTSVSLGRTELPVHFISELGMDDLGEQIIGFLNKNHVSTKFINRFENGQTPIALAFLDQSGNASYSFYKNYPDVRLQKPFPEVNKNDMVLFGSFFSLSPEVRKQVFGFLKQARTAGALIIYDPNIRKPKEKGIQDLLSMVFENFQMAHIIRASHEDFETLFGIDNPVEAGELVRKHSKASLIYTQAGERIVVYSGQEMIEYSVPHIDVVSTIGAGDNFNAGIITALYKKGLNQDGLKTIPPDFWQSIISLGIAFSQEVCGSYENYISDSFAKNII